MTVRTPLYEASHAARYERQDLIRQYQDDYDCRLVVMQDGLFSHSIQLFEETLFDADPRKDLHVILATQGGDGETALRLIRQAQSRCRELTVIVPDQATSDLGPVDPQFQQSDGTLVSARAIIAAVESAEQRVQQHPGTYPIHASLLEPVTAHGAAGAGPAWAHGRSRQGSVGVCRRAD